jgi:hypothetical protein
MEEEIWGVLTVVSGGWHRDRARPVMSFNGDDDFLSTRRQCGSHVLAERAPREGGRLHEAHRGLHRPVEWWRQAVSEEEWMAVVELGGGEWGEGEELLWGADEVRDAPGVLREAFIGAGVEGSGRGRWSAERKLPVVRYQEETAIGRGTEGALWLNGEGECHTPFWDSGNEASIRVPRIFHSHV